MHLNPFDYVALVIAVAVVVGFVVLAYGSTEAGSQIRIQGETRDYIYELATDREVEIPGPLGDTLIEIRAGEVRVVSSPCRDDICVAAGWVSQSGQWIACLPNRVFVRVEHAEEADVDAQTF